SSSSAGLGSSMIAPGARAVTSETVIVRRPISTIRGTSSFTMALSSAGIPECYRESAAVRCNAKEERVFDPAARGSWIVGHGVDLVDVARLARSIEEQGERCVERVCSGGERAYAEAGGRRRMERYAARFAAKEAAFKAVGTGWRSGIAWTDAEVTT